MNETEWLQLAVGGLVVAALAFLLLRWLRAQNAIFPEAAKRYGLAFTQQRQGSVFTNIRQTWQLHGVAQGLPIQVEASYETRGRLRRRGTWVATRAPAGLPPCTINVSRSRPAADVHLVPIGEAHFDARRWLTSDAPAVVRALLTPAARVELLQCPQAELRIVVEGEHLVLSFPGTPSSPAELHTAINAALALARSGAP